jgi:hypothetical protein
MKLYQKLIALRMGSDPRVPRESIGYVQPLVNDYSCPSIVKDSLNQLRQYVSDLVDLYIDNN